MATVTHHWTAVDLAARFGPIPLERVVSRPRPGSATVDDAIRMESQENRLCELIDGVLLEKTMGFVESFLAAQLGALITAFVQQRNLGVTAGEGGMLQLFPDQVRIPDVCFVSWERLKGSGFPQQAAPSLAPDLAVEVLSPGNTDQEMQRKLEEYFQAGVRLVWYVDPRDKSVVAYTAADKAERLTTADILSGGDVLPGLTIDLAKLFEIPMPPGE